MSKQMEMFRIPLSEREEAVALLITNGNSSKEIARILGISYRTVEVHRSHLLTKLCCRNTAEMVREFMK